MHQIHSYPNSANNQQNRDQNGHAQIDGQNDLHHPRWENIEENRLESNACSKHDDERGDCQQNAGYAGDDRAGAQRLAQAAGLHNWSGHGLWER